MADTEWFKLLMSAEKVAFRSSDARKIHYKFKNGKEMVEEYNIVTGVLVKRAWKVKLAISDTTKWDIEVGDPVSITSLNTNEENIGIRESNVTPVVVHRTLKSRLEWKIRNSPYSLETYIVTVDEVDKCIVVRTTNKKYFKKIPMLELQRLNITPKQSDLSITLSSSTLTLWYTKPQELIDFEKLLAKELEKVEEIDDSDMDCKQS